MNAYVMRGWVTSTRVSTNRHDLVSAATEEEAREIAALRHGEGENVQVVAVIEVNYCESCGSFSDEGNHNDPACNGPWSRSGDYTADDAS